MFAVFYMPPSPVETASWFRGKKGWFSEREETILTMRVLRDDPTKSSMHNRQHSELGAASAKVQGLTSSPSVGLRDLWKSFADFDHVPLYLLGITTYTAPGTVNAYFSLTLKSL